MEELKSALEIATYFCAVLFFAGKILYGQANAGMEIGLILNRTPKNNDEDYLSIHIQLKRSGIGRLQLKDILFEYYNPIVSTSEKPEKPCKCHLKEINIKSYDKIKISDHLNRSMIHEHYLRGYEIQDCHTDAETFLPPEDSTQLAHCIVICRTHPLLLDVTILAERTGLWCGIPQWRASAISLPEPSRL